MFTFCGTLGFDMVPEALSLIDQQIQKEMTRSGRTYREVSQELMAKMKAKK